jgi:hypothetical protein
MKAPIRVVTPKLLLDVGYRYRGVPTIVVRKIIAAFSPRPPLTAFSWSPVEIRCVHRWLR